MAHFLCGYSNALYSTMRETLPDFLWVQLATLQFTVFKGTSNMPSSYTMLMSIDADTRGGHCQGPLRH